MYRIIMNNEFIDILKAGLENPEEMKLEQIQKLALEANKYVTSLEASLQSKNPKEKEEAAASAAEIQRFLETKASQLVSYMEKGLTEEESAILSDTNE